MLTYTDIASKRKRGVVKELLSSLFRFLLRYRARLLVFTFVGGTVALMPLLQPLLIQHGVDAVVSRRSADLTAIAVGIAVVGLLTAMLGIVQTWISATLTEQIVFDLRVAMYDRVQRMPVAFFTHTQSGAVVSRFTNDVAGVGAVVPAVCLTLLVGLVTLVWTVGVLAAIDIRLGIVALAVASAGYASRWLGRHVQAITLRLYQHFAAMASLLTERFNLSGAVLVTGFATHDQDLTTFEERAGAVRREKVRAAVYEGAGTQIFVAASALGLAVALLVGGSIARSGAVSLGTLVLLALYVARLQEPMAALANVWLNLGQGLVSYQRVREILDFPSSLPEVIECVAPPSTVGILRFESVGFTYPAAREVAIASLGVPNVAHEAGRPVLVDVSFELKPGRMTGLVGRSGAGKSSIAMLAQRLYDPTEGRVTLDGVDLRQASRSWIASTVGYVAQDAFLFHDSIRNNLLYARPDATDAEIVEACKAARIHDVIRSFPVGYNTVLGDRGVRLSGGEKQRLALARILLRNPQVVVLDEATAHVDGESEALLREAMREVLAERASLVIAHRMSSIVEADEILVLDRGTIVERGAHDDLLGANGLYERLYTLGSLLTAETDEAVIT